MGKSRKIRKVIISKPTIEGSGRVARTHRNEHKERIADRLRGVSERPIHQTQECMSHSRG
jgi:hypothetical protein